jgi:heptosyltransferase-2
MHVAAAAGVPVVALFGPQSPVKFGPWSSRARVIYKGMACSPCRQKFFTECQPSARMRPACVERITVEEVLEECFTIAGSALALSPRKRY